jgi:hypothetical protein
MSHRCIPLIGKNTCSHCHVLSYSFFPPYSVTRFSREKREKPLRFSSHPLRKEVDHLTANFFRLSNDTPILWYKKDLEADNEVSKWPKNGFTTRRGNATYVSNIQFSFQNRWKIKKSPGWQRTCCIKILPLTNGLFWINIDLWW